MSRSLEDVFGPARPWLSLYEPREETLLARRISSRSVGSEDEEQELPLPFELWLAIALFFNDFAAACSLGASCRALRSLCRHPELWEHLCRSSFSSQCGFLGCDDLLRLYGWSWRTMFMERRRLRFDGLYYITTTKYVHGLNEGRGMKEADKDFYHGLMKVQYHRIFRFWPSGDVAVHLTSQHPFSLRRAAAAVTPARRASLLQKMRGACWGRYEVVEEAGQPTTLLARVPLRDPAYPNMVPVTVVYAMALQGEPRAAATNSELSLLHHSCVADRPPHDEQRFDVPQPTCSFVSLASRHKGEANEAAPSVAATEPGPAAA